MTRKKYHVKKGDTVQVISGNHKGNRGKVQLVLSAKDRVVVEGVNLVTKHVKPSAEKPEGGKEKKEAPIHISNVALVDPSTNEVTKVGRKEDANGKLKRYSKKTGEFID